MRRGKPVPGRSLEAAIEERLTSTGIVTLVLLLPIARVLPIPVVRRPATLPETESSNCYSAIYQLLNTSLYMVQELQFRR